MSLPGPGIASYCLRACSWWVRALQKDHRVIEYHDTVEFVPPIHGGVVIKVYDGDTITVASPLDGARCCSPPPLMYRFRVRLRGIDTPEIKGGSSDEKALAVIARDALSAQILGKEVELRNLGTEKYGRILADVYLNHVHMNQWMLDQGYANPYDGGTKSVQVFS